nr:MAG TPA: hypothetical protein [Caudoviricetes sp.]
MHLILFVRLSKRLPFYDLDNANIQDNSIITNLF